MRTILLPIALSALAAGLGCSSSPAGPGTATVASVQITPQQLTLTSIGDTRQLAASARDGSGNEIPGKVPAWSSSAPNIATVDQVTGIVTAIANGGATITATVDNVRGSASLTVAQAGKRLVFTVQPGNTTAGTALAPAVAVSVQDDRGTTVTTATNPVTVAFAANPTGGTLDGTKTVNAVTGVASFSDLTIRQAGNGYTLVASVGSLPNVTSAAFAIVPAAAAKLKFLVQPSMTEGTQAITPPIQVAITDGWDNTVTNATDAVTVALGANPGGGTLSGTLTVAASGGIATFNDVHEDEPGSGNTLVTTDGSLTSATSTPFTIKLTFLTVSAGTYHTCGITTAKATYCWGYNFTGQLGDGSVTTKLKPVLVPPPNGVHFSQVSAGYAQTCAVGDQGAAYCWGDNSTGALGDGTQTTQHSPTPVKPPPVSWDSVKTGFRHTCGVAQGVAYCWGANVNGQLGDGTTMMRTAPTPVANVPTGTQFASISAGANHSCAMTTTGIGYCWGLNLYGQLGDGTGTSSPTLVKVAALPSPATPGQAFTAVSTGFNHTCAVTNSPTYAWCWGLNTSGEVGDHSTTNRASPVEVSSSGGFTAVSAGDHTCTIVNPQSVYCWGLNASGQVGNGTTTKDSIPRLVQQAVGMVVVSAGTNHTCGLTAAGSVYCWGSNAFGQLGDGTNVDRLTPVQIVQ